MALTAAMTALGGGSCDAPCCAMNTSSCCPTSTARAMTKYSRSVLTLAGEFEIAPFCALHRIGYGLIVAAHSPPQTCWNASAWSYDGAHLPGKRLAQRAPRRPGGVPRALRNRGAGDRQASARSARCRRRGRVVFVCLGRQS